jgi:hypothetical protein
MPTIDQGWGTTTSLTITLASLASDTNLLTGRESTSFDLTSVDAYDAMVNGVVTVGTTPTTGRFIEVHAIASMDGSAWPDVFDGTDSAETITSAEIKNTICRPVAVIPTVATSDRAYPFGPISLRDLFGSLPRRVVFFVTHSTAVNLNSTAGNHSISITPITLIST